MLLLLRLPAPLLHPDPISIAAPRFLALLPSPSPRSNRRRPAGVKPSRRGVAGGGAIAAEAPLVLPGRRVLSAMDCRLDLGVKPRARSVIALLALLPNFRPISSRRWLAGRRNDGVDKSSGSSVPSSARGVDRREPHVSREGSSVGEGDGSFGNKL